MIGHGFGPGGKLSFLWRRNLERSKRNRVARNTAAYAVQVVPSIVLIVLLVVDFGVRATIVGDARGFAPAVS